MKKYSSIEEYFKDQTGEDQAILQKFRQEIKSIAPEAIESFSYQLPTFKLNGILVHFAVYSKHFSFYPTPSGISNFKEELSSYKTSKGTIQFPKNKPIPWDLVRNIVKFRVEENIAKKR